jgi:hypothetical protein
VQAKPPRAHPKRINHLTAFVLVKITGLGALTPQAPFLTERWNTVAFTRHLAETRQHHLGSLAPSGGTYDHVRADSVERHDDRVATDFGDVFADEFDVILGHDTPKIRSLIDATTVISPEDGCVWL